MGCPSGIWYAGPPSCISLVRIQLPWLTNRCMNTSKLRAGETRLFFNGEKMYITNRIIKFSDKTFDKGETFHSIVNKDVIKNTLLKVNNVQLRINLIKNFLLGYFESDLAGKNRWVSRISLEKVEVE